MAAYKRLLLELEELKAEVASLEALIEKVKHVEENAHGQIDWIYEAEGAQDDEED